MLKERLNEVVAKLCVTDEAIRDNQSLKDNLGFDSLRIVELIVALEEEFGIELDESDLNPECFNIVADLYSLLGKYIEETQNAV